MNKLETLDRNPPDVLVQNFGEWCVVWPRTHAAKVFVHERVEVRDTWGEGIVCEPRYADVIAEAFAACGFYVIRS